MEYQHMSALDASQDREGYEIDSGGRADRGVSATWLRRGRSWRITARKGKQMIETELRPARQALAGGDGANAARKTKSRLAMRLWTLLHAQALLQGTIGGADGVLNAEDDRWRLAAHRETTHQR